MPTPQQKPIQAINLKKEETLPDETIGIGGFLIELKVKGNTIHRASFLRLFPARHQHSRRGYETQENESESLRSHPFPLKRLRVDWVMPKYEAM